MVPTGTAGTKPSFDLRPSRGLALGDYLCATFCRDWWRRPALMIFATAGVGFCLFASPGMATGDMAVQPDLVTRAFPPWVVAIAGWAALVVMALPTLSALAILLRVRAAWSWHGSFLIRWFRAAARAGGNPAAEFYFGRRARLTRLRLAGATLLTDAACVACADVYKAFLSRGRGLLVLRAWSTDGSRDLVADVSSLGAEGLSAVLGSLDAVLPAGVRWYGRLRPRGGRRVRRDPWDVLLFHVAGTGELKEEWAGWRPAGDSDGWDGRNG